MSGKPKLPIRKQGESEAVFLARVVLFIVRTLDPLPPRARKRVLYFVADKLAEENKNKS